MTASSVRMMTLPEFEKEFCGDILEKLSKLRQAGFIDNSYDDIITDDETGLMYRVLITDAGYIKVDDIFELDKDEFEAKYPEEEFIEARESYLKPYTVATGRAALQQLAKAMRKEAERLEHYYQLQKETERDNSKPDQQGSNLARRLRAGGW